MHKLFDARSIFFVILLLVYVGSMNEAVGQDLPFRHLSIDQGLSQNMTTTICQDYKGFMWFGTKDGLNRYDGYTFKIYKADSFNENTIPDNHITATYEDEYHNLWIGTMYGGLLLYDREQDAFVKINAKNFPSKAKYISSITGTAQTGLIVAFLSGHVVILSAIQKKKATTHTVFSHSTLLVQKENELQIPVKAILAPDGLLWVSGKQGYKLYDPIKKERINIYQSYPTYVQEYDRFVPANRRRDDSLSPFFTSVQDLKWDKDGIFWMNSHVGLYRFDPVQKEIILYRFSTSLYSVLPIEEGNGEKQLLVDSYADKLLKFNPVTGQVKKIHLNWPDDREILDVRFSVMQTSKDGCIWLGSNGRGIFFSHPYLSLFSKGKMGFSKSENFISSSLYTILQRKSPVTGHEQILFSTLQSFGQLDIAPNGTVVSFNEVDLRTRCIVEDQKRNIWIGSPMGLVQYNPENHVSDLKVPLKNSMIMSIYLNSGGIIWFSTHSNLFSFDPVQNKVKRFPFLPENNDKMVAMNYSTIQPDPDGSLWIGTATGLLQFSTKAERYIKAYKSDPKIPQSLSTNDIKCIYIDPDSAGNDVWVGTSTGLNRLDKRKGTFEHFTTDDGLPNNTVYGILDDEMGNLWLSSNRGISMFNPKTKSFINFDVQNGLQSNEFNTGAYFKSRSGELFFAGINGYNRFYPQNVKIQNHTRPIVIAQVKQIGAGKKEAFYFSETKPNLLRYDQNNISIDLASLDYLASDRINYAYRILNQDTSWINIGRSRNILLTNLSAGRYVFQGRGTDGLGRWNDQWVEMTYVIAPPWWRTQLAYVIYLLALLGGIYGFWRRYQHRLLLQQNMENERRKAQDILALDQIKSRFLANITHEFRTPLTLINGHLEQLEENASVISKETRYKEMKQNSHHLLGLINQLMDLSKIESGAYKIRYCTKDLVQELQMLVSNFAAYSMQKQIKLQFQPCAEVQCATRKFTYDENVVRTIVSNLLSNACKFTPEYGFIQVTLSSQPDVRELTITVSDTGIGISQQDLTRIFDRFYQSDDSSGRYFGGSGIGLSLVKELAILHGGHVKVESEPEVGSRFTITLKEGESGTDYGYDMSMPPAAIQQVLEETVVLENETALPTILIAEDHLELRRFIRDSLGAFYHYIEASGGIEALALATSHIPDLVISDVMMPEMDGLELCKRIKNQDATSHIPIILLTARADQEDKLEGLENGADDYLTKPFSVHELRIRIKNILHSRKILQKRYQMPFQLALKDKSKENTYLVKIEALIRSRATDYEFGVERLAQILLLSTAQLNRKIKAITGQTTVLFIQNVKMQMALELLSQGEKNIAEIAYEVGFENPGYFSKVFKKHFGFTPSEREKLKEYRVNIF